jgi:hypothetical protein
MHVFDDPAQKCPFCLKVDGNEKLGVGKETVSQLLSGIVAIESYFKCERVLSL